MVVGFADLLNEDVLNRPALLDGQVEREEMHLRVARSELHAFEFFALQNINPQNRPNDGSEG